MSAIATQCPLCGSSAFSTIANGVSALRKCRGCGCMVNSGYTPLAYNEEYFTGDYSKQYGRTYEEDEPAISALALRRLNRMRQLWRPCRSDDGPGLLDIGSALGFFLNTARRNGFSRVKGVEISQFAARYTMERFGINVYNSTFGTTHLEEKYDAVTAWYFIEHCAEPLSTLEKIYSLLVEGGIFAFSTPSWFGPLYVFNRDEWVRVHPPDHRIDFSPGSVRSILKRIGFRRVVIDAAGVHPERILSPDSAFYKPFSMMYRPLSRILGFSDTIEVYAIR